MEIIALEQFLIAVMSFCSKNQKKKKKLNALQFNWGHNFSKNCHPVVLQNGNQIDKAKARCKLSLMPAVITNYVNFPHKNKKKCKCSSIGKGYPDANERYMHL